MQSQGMNRRQPLLVGKDSPASVKDDRRKAGEVAGETAAECAAVCCCCPCAVVNLLVLAVYKVPAGLCRKAFRKKQLQSLIKKKKKAALQQQQQRQQPNRGPSSSFGELDVARVGSDLIVDLPGDASPAAVDFEDDTWDKFYGAGFWRSNSQREA